MRFGPGLRCLALLTIAAIAFSCATGGGGGFAREAMKERSSHDKSKDKDDDSDDGSEQESPQLTIVTEPRDARISVDGNFVGFGSATIDSFRLGQTVKITAEARSYRSKTISVALWGQTDTIALDLDPILGTLDLKGEGLEDAQFLLPGWTLSPGANKVIIGEHQVLARKFGYGDQRHRVVIKEDQTTTLELKFTAVPFSLTGLTNDKPDGFNPESSAIAAQTRITFVASGPGHALAILRDKSGAELARWDYPNLTSWNQEAQWDGRADGQPLPNGTYRLTLTGGAAGQPDTQKVTLKIRIDRTLIDRDRASIGPAGGLLWTPVPEVLSPGTLQASLLTLAHVEDWMGHAPVSASLRFAPDHGWELFAQSSVRFWSDYHLNSAYATFAVKRRIAIDSPDFRVAWVAGGTLGSWLYDRVGIPPTDFLTTFPALRASLPASWDWGKWTIVVAPEVDWSFWSPATAYESSSVAAEGPRLWGYGRFGLAYDPGPYSFAISGAARTRSFDRGTGWLAPAHLGFEGRYIVPDSPVTLTGYLSVSAYNSVDYAWYGGVGVSFLLPASLTLDLASQLQQMP